MQTLLVIDDDRPVQHVVTKGLTDLELKIIASGTAEEGLRLVRSEKPDVVLLDIMLPDMSGLECFQKIRALDNRLPVMFITASESSEMAIQAMQLGAYSYIVKPLNVPKLKESIKQALRNRRMMSVKVQIPTSGISRPETKGDLLVGRSEKMLEVYAAIGRVANQNVTVLIRGENGTGKELIARAIYQHSPRRDRPFLAVNCAALPDSLLESELFGHEKGSFTGAESRHIGKFEQCNGGTIFLDEVGDMAPLVQSKVLRLIQEQKFERVGGTETISTDVRIITATNRNLEHMMEAGHYRPDLYYRLNGFTIELPPLRERGKDVEILLEHFLNLFSRSMGKENIEGISPEATAVLTSYSWPGNVRELQSVIRQCLLNATGPVIVPEFLPQELLGASTAPKPQLSEETPTPEPDAQASDLRPFVNAQLQAGAEELYASTLELMERYLLTRVLSHTGGNQSQAAKILGITRGSLRTKIRSLNISIGSVISVEAGDDEDESIPADPVE